MDGEFSFLRCEKCQSEVENHKLLPCLHNLCTECLEKTQCSGLCVICQTPHSQNAEPAEFQDNRLFSKLQAILSIYQKIVEGNNLTCGECGKEGRFWCSDCKSFFCSDKKHGACLESHQARLLEDIRAKTCKEFLSWNWKRGDLSCPKEDHNNEDLCIYCKECKEFLCGHCILLDRGHAPSYWNIKDVIQKRQKDLESVSVVLTEKKRSYNDTRTDLQEQQKKMEDMYRKTKNQITQQMEEVLQILGVMKERFLAEVEDQHQKQVQDVEMKQKDTEDVLKRLASREELLEIMNCYAHDQEFEEMHPLIRESLENFGQKWPPAVDSEIQVGNFAEVTNRVQHLFEMITKYKYEEDVPPGLEMTSRKEHLLKSPAKRKCVAEERATQTPPKVSRNEETNELVAVVSTSSSFREQPGTCVESAGSGLATGSRDDTEESTTNDQGSDSSSLESSDAGPLQLGGPAAAVVDGSTKDWPCILKYWSMMQDGQSIPEEDLLNKLPLLMDSNLAKQTKPVQSPRRPHFSQDDVYIEENPRVASLLLGEGSDARTIHSESSGARIRERNGSPEEVSEGSTVNMMEGEVMPEWLWERHNFTPTRDLQEVSAEIEGHQEVEVGGGLDPQSLHPPELKDVSSLWAEARLGHQTWVDTFRKSFYILFEHVGFLTKATQNVMGAMEKQDSCVKDNFKKFHEDMALLLNLVRDAEGEVDHDERGQPSPSVQDSSPSADVTSGNYSCETTVKPCRQGNRGRGRGQCRRRRKRYPWP